MPVRHVLLALSVVVMWGINFIAMDAALQHFPPFLLAALRFAVIAIPTLLLVPRPQVEWKWLIGYGLGFGTLQFLFLFWAMAEGMPAGLASLVLQSSAPFTVLLGMVFLRERLTGIQVVGILIAVGGLTVVGWYRWETASVVPFLLTLAGAFGWAFGNICNRQSGTTEPVRLTMWMSIVPPVPMLALSLAVEGPAEIAEAFAGVGTQTGLLALAGLAYLVTFGTVIGTGIWTWLMARHEAGVVAPFSLLVPVVGMSAAWLVLGQTVSWQELGGAVLIVGGVFLGSIRLGRWRRATRRWTVDPRLQPGTQPGTATTT
ncbi:EamA family transporter [Brevibacterium daeguense]|uniref:EamA family transporter n=1 Tax=Brevibacterium daeguense TaxID=909936 RepID=A0ABP8EID8_9MICO|nr:EamA family transporter [Brevibacterium daeguense]